jgi:hypothetical protein
MMRRLLTLYAASCVAVIASAESTAAQEIAGTFDQLRVLVKVGDRVRVTDTTGRELSGTIAALDLASLGLVSDGVRRNFGADEISTIRQRRPDPLANGAKWGLAVGGGLGLLLGVAVSTGDGTAVLIPIFGLAYGGIGAGIGAGFDALVSGEQVIYARRIVMSVRF